ncbi:MAG: Asp-tRNA(Asn)/Glu-tRNA(Gln) amidotransferase subunit GatC [Anaerolineae bacterium]|nr:Asp-tRNA(Asn)/Glu-tRNA(Gln) amidotransferase subunit GatC [Anaerolineae bacterium]MCB9141357.1 Asp-tRNA(Asn)/Glu-tRNA(Gln) amidotransferase subunit GatC [Anaerolineales bacterium]MCB0230598.1 Asp-tRNA(Asn)/Glu-tRNA(Gln) amidotransferase subunit GatC [Anaerolineae bacterium]MCB0237293.1 Asp-tRNA(Asn)/Glu-tRNA(Gln) amidotransferase subunit GatC [Anaerolineae bacterium]MCB0247999.1 Asp-tRNA(Asn)/Glu-tRNA(Gln) amidotransferase subunit GatC [Anaerolineae bacterium]
MSLTTADVEHIAHLARLELTTDEIEQYRRQLSDILAHFDVLAQVDTSAIAPTASVLSLRSVMRRDEVRPGLSTDDALANAPDSADGFFRVPAIFGDDANGG